MEEKALQNDNPNMELYEKLRKVPEEAQREIKGGKLKGFTDINPMWRIKALTEAFGPCGVGWKAPIIERWVEDGADGEKIANVKINLFIKHKPDSDWNDPIEGMGGSMLIAYERGELTSNDEAFKMAYTDAISVACKMLGVGADVYYEKDRTKYDAEGDGKKPKASKENNQDGGKDSRSKYQIVKDLINGTSVTFANVEEWLEKKTGKKSVNSASDEMFAEMIKSIKAKIEKDKQVSNDKEIQAPSDKDNQTPWNED